MFASSGISGIGLNLRGTSLQNHSSHWEPKASFGSPNLRDKTKNLADLLSQAWKSRGSSLPSPVYSFLPANLLLSLQELYQPNVESLRLQEERKRLYQRQQEKGGIIDLEAERNRYFISLQQVRKRFPTPPIMTPTFLPTPLCPRVRFVLPREVIG